MTSNEKAAASADARETGRSRPRHARCGRPATTTASRPAPSGSSGRFWSKRARSSLGSTSSTAAGTGNVAIRAAEAGARVVASDLTPENFDAGRDEACRRNVQLDWVEADAEALPFANGDFDVVTSSLGAIFARSPQGGRRARARPRPGGTIGMLNFTPDGLAADFFGTFAPYLPPPPTGALPPCCGEARIMCASCSAIAPRFR